jgi:pyruvate ferredoxin oxidoreductase gamma subunit
MPWPSPPSGRSGAPVVTFVRISETPIRQRCQVVNPAILIIQDAALLHVPGVTRRAAGRGAGGDTGELRGRQRGPGRPARSPHGGFARQWAGHEISGPPGPTPPCWPPSHPDRGPAPGGPEQGALASRFRGEVLERNIRLIQEAAQQVPAVAPIPPISARRCAGPSSTILSRSTACGRDMPTAAWAPEGADTAVRGQGRALAT